MPPPQTSAAPTGPEVPPRSGGSGPPGGRTVLVTGAAGRLGRAVVPRLAGAGWRVVAADRRAPADGLVAGVPVTVTDLAGPGGPDALAGLVAGCDAVVHLAGHPSPYGQPGHEVFANNTRATYHVLAAAAGAGVRTAVIAASTAAYGLAFAARPTSPLYAPVDEAHPLLPQDPYSLSRQVDEATAAMLARRHGMTVVALRFHWVATPAEVARRVAEVRADPEVGRSVAELWGYVEAGDAATACLAALDVPAGCHAVNITAPDTLSDIPTADLLARHHPSTRLDRPLAGTESAWSNDRARALLGFAPGWSWRTGGAGPNGSAQGPARALPAAPAAPAGPYPPTVPTGPHRPHGPHGPHGSLKESRPS